MKRSCTHLKVKNQSKPELRRYIEGKSKNHRNIYKNHIY